MKFIQSEYLVENPKYTSIHQKKDEERCTARKKAGLEPEHVEIKITSKDPTL